MKNIKNYNDFLNEKLGGKSLPITIQNIFNNWYITNNNVNENDLKELKNYLNNDGNPNISYNDENLLLKLSYSFNNMTKIKIKMINLLLDNDVDVNVLDEDDCSIIHLLIEHDDNKLNNMIEKALKNIKKEVLNQINSEGLSPFLIASNNDNMIQMKLLYKYGADLDFKDDDGWTALMGFANNYNTDKRFIKFLLSINADMHIRNNVGDDFIDILKKKGNLDEFKFSFPEYYKKYIEKSNNYIEKYNSLDELLNRIKSSIEALSPLDYIFILIKEYINNDGEPDKITEQGRTATIIQLLIEIEEKDVSEIIKYLIDNGADPNFINILDFNYLELCVDAGRFELLDVFTDAGTDWDYVDPDGNEFLRYLKEKNIKEYKRIINKYPEKAKNFLKKQKTQDFNL